MSSSYQRDTEKTCWQVPRDSLIDPPAHRRLHIANNEMAFSMFISVFFRCSCSCLIDYSPSVVGLPRCQVHGTSVLHQGRYCTFFKTRVNLTDSLAYLFLVFSSHRRYRWQHFNFRNIELLLVYILEWCCFQSFQPVQPRDKLHLLILRRLFRFPYKHILIQRVETVPS